MIEQTGVAITFLAQFLVSGAKGTGLTITCAVRRVSDDTEVVAATAATELGTTGIYKYVYNAPATEDLYVGHFNQAAATADQTDVASLWAVGKGGIENLDASISTVDTVVDSILEDTATLGGSTVTVSAPVASNGVLSLVRGDDYLNAEGRVLQFSSATWPDLTAASAIVLSIRKRASATGLGSTLRATVAHRAAGLVAGGGTQTVEFEPSASDLATIDVGTAACVYDVQATLASGSIVTLQTGAVNVTEDQTRA
jgi:hypothetical protein